ESSGKWHAICAGIAPIPLAGTAVSPSESILKTNSNMRLEGFSSPSKKIPAKRGRRKRGANSPEKPSPLTASLVEVSGRRKICSIAVRRSRERRRATRILSQKVPKSDFSAAPHPPGVRHGSTNSFILPANQERAPGENFRKSKAW